MQASKRAESPLSFDLIAPNEETLELLRPLLPSVDYFMPSLEEAAFPSGETQPEAIGRFFLALGVGTCILKDGENGSWLIGRDGGPQAYCAVAGRGGGYHRLRRQLLRRVDCRTGARTQRESSV